MILRRRRTDNHGTRKSPQLDKPGFLSPDKSSLSQINPVHLDPVYTMPVEFENGIKKCRFGLPFTRCRQNLEILPAEFCFG